MSRTPLLLLALFVACEAPLHAQQRYDVVVYGGCAGGVTAAVQTARMGKSVLLIAEQTARGSEVRDIPLDTYKLAPKDSVGVLVEGVLGIPTDYRPSAQKSSKGPLATVGDRTTIASDGTVSLPMLDKPIRIGGVTILEAEKAIIRAYDAAQILNAEKAFVLITLENGLHIGGLTTGGLGATDIGNKAAIGGLSREFYQSIRTQYELPYGWREGRHPWNFQTPEDYAAKRKGAMDQDTMWMFEPHVAEAVLRGMLAEANVPVVFGQRLDLKNGVTKNGLTITSIRMETGEVYAAKIFIDATYEGDLMAKAGCSYAVGRESNSQYGETLNGVQLGSVKHQFSRPIDPYVKPGDPSSGLLPGVHGGSPGEHGQGDHRVQAYNFRMCLTDVPENRVPFPKPEGYDPARYEISARMIAAGAGAASVARRCRIARPTRTTPGRSRPITSA